MLINSSTSEWNRIINICVMVLVNSLAFHNWNAILKCRGGGGGVDGECGRD